MKNGPPARAVITPTGNSEAPVTILAIASQTTKKIAPTIIDAGNRIR